MRRPIGGLIVGTVQKHSICTVADHRGTVGGQKGVVGVSQEIVLREQRVRCGLVGEGGRQILVVENADVHVIERLADWDIGRFSGQFDGSVGRLID